MNLPKTRWRQVRLRSGAQIKVEKLEDAQPLFWIASSVHGLASALHGSPESLHASSFELSRWQLAFEEVTIADLARGSLI